MIRQLLPLFFLLLAGTAEGLVKIAYYRPSVFHSDNREKMSSAEYQVELFYPVIKNLNVFGNFAYVSDDVTLDGRTVSYTFYPATIGLKYIQPLTSFLKGYAFIGPRYCYIGSKDEGAPFAENFARMGGAAGSGLLLFFSQHWCLDLFGEWSTAFAAEKKYQAVLPSPIVGWNIGGGLAYVF